MIGGSACPRAMTQTFQDKYGVEVIHAWGMTEMSPLGSLCTMKPEYAELAGEARLDVQMKQGHPPFGVEMKITDDSGKRRCRGTARPSAASRCAAPRSRAPISRTDSEILDEDGFFDTGDVATIDQHGYMQITDRSKDVIKSGGEWISSIDLENLAVGHPKVAEAAVIGVRHPKWDERPLLVIVLKKDQTASKDDILGFMEGKIAKWWMPDDVAFVDEIPHTATGKILKTALREQFKDYTLPTAHGVNSTTSREHACRSATCCFTRLEFHTLRASMTAKTAPAAQIALAEAADSPMPLPPVPPPCPARRGPLRRRPQRILAAADARRGAARGHARHLPVLARDRRAALPVVATPKSPARAWNTPARATSC